MKVEARLVGLSVGNSLSSSSSLDLGEDDLDKDDVDDASRKSILHAEIAAWSKLFSPRYIKRTSIGICMMFFQRTFQHSTPVVPAENSYTHMY